MSRAMTARDAVYTDQHRATITLTVHIAGIEHEQVGTTDMYRTRPIRGRSWVNVETDDGQQLRIPADTTVLVDGDAPAPTPRCDCPASVRHDGDADG